MSEAWPSNVTQNMIAGSYNEKPVSNNRISFQPEVGPDLMARRSSMKMRDISFRSKMTQAERVALLEYYEDTLKSGVLVLSRKNPKTSDTFYGTFAAEPTFTDAGPGVYIVTLSFHVLP